MKTLLVALGLFVLGFGGVTAVSGGLPMALFNVSEPAAPRNEFAELQLVTLADYAEAAEKAYERMLSACSTEDRKAYGRAMDALAVAKRRADTGRMERGNIGDRMSELMTQFVEAVRMGVITDDHVPFGSMRTVLASVQKKAAADGVQPEPVSFALRGRIGESGKAQNNDCQAL